MIPVWIVLYLAVHNVHVWVDHHMLLAVLIAIVTA